MNLVRAADLLSVYRVVFLDSYGVIKNHQGLIPGIQGTIDFLNGNGIPFRILTNDASRSQIAQVEKFDEMGLKGIEPYHVVTSGMMARLYLKFKIHAGIIAYIGTEQAAEIILQDHGRAVPVHQIDLEMSGEISAIVFLDDEGYDWRSTINHCLNILRRVNIPVIIANTDQIYPVTKNDVSLATGGIAQLIENVIRRNFIKFGKPDSQMFSYAFDELLKVGHQIERSDVLMVGDTLHTDILGGNRFGTRTALVLSGNTTKANAQLLIDSTGVRPDYILENIIL